MLAALLHWRWYQLLVSQLTYPIYSGGSAISAPSRKHLPHIVSLVLVDFAASITTSETANIVAKVSQ